MLPAAKALFPAHSPSIALILVIYVCTVMMANR